MKVQEQYKLRLAEYKEKKKVTEELLQNATYLEYGDGGGTDSDDDGEDALDGFVEGMKKPPAVK